MPGERKMIEHELPCDKSEFHELHRKDKKAVFLRSSLGLEIKDTLLFRECGLGQEYSGSWAAYRITHKSFPVWINNEKLYVYSIDGPMSSKIMPAEERPATR